MLCMGNGKEILKRGDIWIPIADSLCHRAEPDRAVQSNQSKKKKKKGTSLEVRVASHTSAPMTPLAGWRSRRSKCIKLPVDSALLPGEELTNQFINI